MGYQKAYTKKTSKIGSSRRKRLKIVVSIIFLGEFITILLRFGMLLVDRWS
jgi:hypothetical protein